ncbi:MAG TPA: LPS export ABC transporter periplasmic protein LptC [Gemmatimonadales bacterium]|nr:LPS export ABC transporter periplasmic protein LptC [Gemmatimonadales bacterium]
MTGTRWSGDQQGRGNALRRPALAVLCACFALLGCQEEVVRPSVTLEAADTADQVLYGMEHYVTDQGLRRSLVEADTAYVYQNTQMVEMRGVKVTFYSPSGEITSTVTGDSGTYLTRDGSMSARGNVVAVTPDGRTLRSQELKYDSRSQKISSDKPFVYDRADQHLEGNGFTSDPDFRNVVTKQPRGGQRPNAKPGDSTGFLLPGQ